MKRRHSDSYHSLIWFNDRHNVCVKTGAKILCGLGPFFLTRADFWQLFWKNGKIYPKTFCGRLISEKVYVLETPWDSLPVNPKTLPKRSNISSLHTVRGPIKLPWLKLHFAVKIEISKCTLISKWWKIFEKSVKFDKF